MLKQQTVRETVRIDSNYGARGAREEIQNMSSLTMRFNEQGEINAAQSQCRLGAGLIAKPWQFAN